MPMQPQEIRDLVKERGWTFADLAARWGHSVFYMSRLVNQPHSRPPVYEDAFRGLPRRESTEVKREARHVRRKKPSALWTKAQMFPEGRVFESLDNRYVEEGTRLAVKRIEVAGPTARVHFTLIDCGAPLDLDADVALQHFQDLGFDVQR
jgi:hypothetical protein